MSGYKKVQEIGPLSSNKIGQNGHPAYAYLGYDVDRGSDESHKALKRASQKRTNIAELPKTLENSGLFMLVSSLPFEEDGILPAYYTRRISIFIMNVRRK